MTNSKEIFFAFLFTGCLMGSAHGQQGLLGAAGTYSNDGWKFSVSYVVDPPLSPGQYLSIQGATDVMHTDAKAGRPAIFHRFLIDPVAKTYWGYDVEVEPMDKIGSARLRFKPFSLRADQLPKEYHAKPNPIHIPNIAEFRALATPQFPAEAFRSGQTIAVDVLKNPATGQRVVDYIEVEFEPIHMPSKAEARDFQVSDVVLHILVPSLRVNGAEVPPAIVASRMVARKLVWLSVPGHGRFLLSLAPYAGYPFQKSGEVNGFGLSFSWNGDRYEWHSREAITESSGAWNLYVLAAPLATTEATAQGFSFGGVNSVEEFLPKAQ
jgi:hypothetical protein